MTLCNRLDCRGGEIDETGYCGTCGRRPIPGLHSAAGPQFTGPARPRSIEPGRPGTRSAGTSRTGTGTSSGISVPPGPWWGRVLVPVEEAAEPGPRLLSSTTVPENLRFCEKCGEPVGRHGRDTGRCTACGSPFDFTPRIREGDLVDGRYLVRGVLSHGGFGWAYLAENTELSHPVVLKGVLVKAAAETLERERTLLTELHHPYIVRIWGYVSEGQYLVTEYAGGQTLQPVTLDEPLPPMLALCLQLLEALDYLHARGLVHCDVKPQNVVRGGDRIRLIDFGAVRRLDDEAPVWACTERFAPPRGDPEWSRPTAAFDLFGVGCTLGALCRDHLDLAPDSPGIRSLGLLIGRATHAEPTRRFVSARQFAEQLSGVIHQIVQQPGVQHRSVVFASMTDALDGGLGDVLPLEAWLGARRVPEAMVELTTGPFRCPAPEDAAAALPVVLPDPWEITEPGLAVDADLDACHAAVRQGDPGAAEEALRHARIREQDWRAGWYCALISLARADVPGARDAFERVRAAVPGELIPLLALGLCAEMQGDPSRAATFYQQVSDTDESVVAAHFGLARVLLGQGRRDDAVTALDRVPHTSRYEHAGRIAAARSLLTVVMADGAAVPPDASDTDRGRELAGDLHLEGLPAALLAAEAAYADAVRESVAPPDTVRAALEKALRDVARVASSAQDHRTLVDLANTVRPVTLWSP